jgi:hypothetical protein
MGFEVRNPAEVDGGQKRTWSWYMRRALEEGQA